jgi:hypothetical protein
MEFALVGTSASYQLAPLIQRGFAQRLFSDKITAAMNNPCDMLKPLAAALMLALVAATSVADDPPSAQLVLPDLAGRSVKPFGGRAAKAVVFIFIRTDCPISNRYAPELERLRHEFAAQPVRFYLVYPGADETVAAIAQHQRDYAYQFAVLRDPQHALVQLASAQVTPEAAVFAPDKAGYRLVYRGRLDDRVAAFGKIRPTPTRRELRQTLRALLRGAKPAFTTQPAIGCYIAKTDER